MRTLITLFVLFLFVTGGCDLAEPKGRIERDAKEKVAAEKAAAEKAKQQAAKDAEAKAKENEESGEEPSDAAETVKKQGTKKPATSAAPKPKVKASENDAEDTAKPAKQKKTTKPKKKKTAEAEEDAEPAPKPAKKSAKKTASDSGDDEGREEVKADVGAGKKGHYGSAGGEKVSDIITVPLEAHFRTQERIRFQKIDHDLTHYRAMHDGKGPKTQEEFENEILKPARIDLPPLPEGQTYKWDPDADNGKGELKVSKPRREE
ncbi:hypothetical protein FACS189419_07650 [Planctomycetales bacterium]|nr:hypothetical protein FACS189419_07650 [Planctomycetales bacterium]